MCKETKNERLRDAELSAKIERLEKAVAALCHHTHNGWYGNTSTPELENELAGLVLGNQRLEAIDGFLNAQKRTNSGAMSPDPNPE